MFCHLAMYLTYLLRLQGYCSTVRGRVLKEKFDTFRNMLIIVRKNIYIKKGTKSIFPKCHTTPLSPSL